MSLVPKHFTSEIFKRSPSKFTIKPSAINMAPKDYVAEKGKLRILLSIFTTHYINANATRGFSHFVVLV